jgi:hypothetical protein
MRVLRQVVNNGARLVRAVLALSILVALVGGLPWLLARFVGWPLPRHVPTWDEVQVFLTSPFTDQVLIDMLACACWVAWAAFTVETALAVIDATADLRRDGWTHPSDTRSPGAGPGHMRPLGRVATALVSAVLVAGTPGPRDAAHLHLASVSVVAADVPQPGLTASSDTSSRGPSGHHPETRAGADRPRARHVVVRPPHGDRHDSLWRIAERELGDPRLWPAIYDLNVGKRQPDGHRLWDPDLLQPGWVLELPQHHGVATEQPAPTESRDADRPPPAGSVQPTSPVENGSTSRPTPLPSSPSPTASQTEPPQATPSTSPPATAPMTEPSAQPEHAPATTAPHTRTVGVELSTGGYVGIGLVLAVSALLGITRLRRRRRDPLTGPVTFRLPLQLAPGEPPPAVVQALRRAHLGDALRRHEPTTHITDTDVPTPQVLPGLDDQQLRRIWSDPDTWAVRASVTADAAAIPATTTTPADPPGLVVDIGTKDEREVLVDLARVRALGLDGPGGVSAVRAITAALLTRVRHGHPARLVDIVTSQDDAARLLGRHLDDPAPPGLHVAASARDALDLAEEGLSARANGETPQPHVLLLLTRIWSSGPVPRPP